MKPTKAEIYRDTDFIGKMECYLKIKHGKKLYQGPISMIKGTSPQWNESYGFVSNASDDITLELFDYDRLKKDDHIGEASIDLFRISKNGEKNKWESIYYKGKLSGKIYIEFSTVIQEQAPLLFLKPLNAELARDTDSFGKMDPFVKLLVDGKSFNSSICFQGGKAPTWRDVFLFPFLKKKTALISIWELDGAEAELVGESNVNLSVIAKGNKMQKIEIFHKGKKAGELNIEVILFSY